METIPEIFTRGKEAYDGLFKRLYDFYTLLPLSARKELFNDKSKKINNSIDSIGFKNMSKDFNCLVQYALLDCATTTDKVSYLEMLFIADIGDYKINDHYSFRIDHYLAATMKKSDKRIKNTYLMLPDQLPEDILYIKSCFYQFIEPIKARIMKAFQVINRIAKTNRINDLLQDFADLFDAFLNVDKRIDKEDPVIAVNKMKEMFYNHIDDYKNKVKGLMK